jgi:putative MATE family efflux protein
MTNSLTIKLTSMDLFKKTFFSMGLLVFTSLYTIVDSLFISNYVNTNALAALNLAFPLIILTNAFAFMFSTGGSTWVSIKLGEKEEKQASKDFSLIVLFAFLVSILLAIIIEIYLDPIVHILGATRETFTYTKQYLRIVILTSPIFILQIIFQGFMFVDNKGRLAFRLVVISGVANIVFDYIFIKIFKMGISGAAWGTAIGYLVWGVYGTIYFLKNKKGLHFAIPSKNKRVISRSISNGMSEMVTNLSSSVTTFYFNYLTLKYIGTDGVAAISIILYCQFLFSSIFFGFAIGSAPLIGYAWGAKKYEYTDKLIKLCFRLVFIFSIIMFAISFFGSNIVTGFFCRPENSVYDIATRGLRLFSFNFLVCGISIISSNIFTSIGDGKKSATLSFLRVFVFTLLFLTILPKILGTDGIWLAIPLAEAVMIFIDAIFLSKLSFKLKKLEIQEQQILVINKN